MALKRIILEMGHGNDMHGGDYTKAALRAVQDCIHHSSMIFLRTLKIDTSALEIEVTIGVQRPEMVDTAKVAASLPVGANVFMFSQRYGVAQDLVAATMAVSTAMALGTVTLAMAWVAYL